MQRNTKFLSQQQLVKPADARRGPTLIDPRDFKFVSGGLPKGGWGGSGVVPVPESLPKGGW